MPTSYIVKEIRYVYSTQITAGLCYNAKKVKKDKEPQKNGKEWC